MDAASFRKPSPEIDITVVGSDLVAIVFAYACLSKGFSVQVIREHTQPSFKTMTLCQSELNTLRPPMALQQVFVDATLGRWNELSIQLHKQHRVTVQAEYALYDQVFMYRNLLKAVTDLGAQVHTDSIDNIIHAANHYVAVGQQSYASRFVVVTDRTDLIHRPEHPKPVYRFVYEQLIETTGRQTDTDSVQLMNFQLPSRFRRHYQTPPSFLSVFPLSNHRAVLQESILSTHTNVGKGFLKQRLDLRKSTMMLGQSNEMVLEEQLTRIPMGGGLPVCERTLALGLAAGNTDPFVGIRFGHCLQNAFLVASSLRSNWLQTPGNLSRSIWNALQSHQNRSSRKLYLLELDMLSRFNLREVQSYLGVLLKDSKSIHRVLTGNGPSAVQKMAAQPMHSKQIRMSSPFGKLHFPLHSS